MTATPLFLPRTRASSQRVNAPRPPASIGQGLGATARSTGTIVSVTPSHFLTPATEGIRLLVESLEEPRSQVVVLASSDLQELHRLADELLETIAHRWSDIAGDVWRLAPSETRWSAEDVRKKITPRLLASPRVLSVLLIERADTLSTMLADRLLKVLEAPPAPTLWLLCTPTPESLPVTVRSRVSVTISAAPELPMSEQQIVPTSTPFLDAVHRSSSLSSTAGESREEARELVNSWRHDAALRVAGINSPEEWQRLYNLASALDRAEEVSRTNGRAASIVAEVFAAVGVEPLPAVVHVATASAHNAVKPKLVTNSVDPYETFVGPGDASSGSIVPRWSPPPQFVPRRGRHAPAS